MEYVDPFAVVGNSATLKAYGDRLKAARKASQPFTTVFPCVFIPWMMLQALGFGLVLAGQRDWPARHGVPLISALLLVIGGPSGLISAFLQQRYLKAHPFDPHKIG